MSAATVCDKCRCMIPPAVARVVMPPATPLAMQFDYHLSCWAQIVAENERKAEDSNPSRRSGRTG